MHNEVWGCAETLPFFVTDENKTKNIEGLMHVRVVHLSCLTGLSPRTGGHCFVHQPIPW